MTAVIIIVGLAILGGFLFWQIRKKKAKHEFQTWHGVPIPRDRPFKVRTASGVWVESVVPISIFVEGLINIAHEELVAGVGRFNPNWIIPGLQVFILEPMAYYHGQDPRWQGAPQFQVGDGRFCSGLTIGVGNDGYPTPTIVVPHQQGQDWQFVEWFRESVRNEGEHVVLNHNDPALFQHYTNENDIHPIFP